jgi:hypothetical protein
MSLTATYCFSLRNALDLSLTQDEIIEILDQPKTPNWHEAMISANIDIFEMKKVITLK